MELQKTVGGLCKEVERMSVDIRSHGDKIDVVRQQISFVKGAVWVIGGLVTFAIVGAGVYLRLMTH